MLALGQNNLYDFRLQTLTDVDQVLLRVLDQKERLLSLGEPAIEKMLGYFEVINTVASTPPPGKAMRALHDTAISFLDKDLIEIFLKDPGDVEVRNAVSVQLLFVSAMTNTLKVTITPYTEEEMIEILKGKQGVSYYDDLNFIYTLRQIFEANVSPNIFSLMTKSLAPVVDESNTIQLYFWSDAFILTSLLHTIWRHFSLLSESDQQFLLQNYFYQSIVVGIPVRFYISDACKRASSQGTAEKTFRFFRENLLSGKESLPNDTLMRQGQTLGTVVKEFTQKAAAEQINTLVQEKLIAERYRGQADSSFFSDWLREVLTTVSQLASGDILKV